MDPGLAIQLRGRIASLVSNPDTPINTLGLVYLVLLETGMDSFRDLFEDIEERLANDFLMIDDAILDRLHEDVIRVPTWPPRPRNTRFAESLINRQKQVVISRFAWRLVVELPRKPVKPPQWSNEQYCGRARYDGTYLPPISYEDYKAGRHFPPSTELMNIGRFADAGPVAALAGIIAILLGYDADGIARAMDANQATDLALSAMAITQKGAVSDMGAHQFSVTNQGVMSAPPQSLGGVYIRTFSTTSRGLRLPR
jgi:hypothetical protein